MKILNLSLKNLNALKGNWHIDLTNPAFDDGIFAIVGKTGAGKTTILDAICLAIYGQTPRIHNISATHNDLMSLDTGECSAQVELLMNGEFYRFRWEQARANKKANGKLQPIKRQISQLAHPYDEAGEILESKATLCDKLAVEILGMSFGQFTRSVMLAQGDFNAFLKAESDEKSEILEQITGTDIYSKIGAKVYDITSQKRLALNALQEKLGETHVLSDDKLATLHATLTSQNHALHSHKAELLTLESNITHHQDQLRLGAELDELAKQLPPPEDWWGQFLEKLHHSAPHTTTDLSQNIRALQKLDNDLHHHRQSHQQLSEHTHRQITDKIRTISEHITATQAQIRHHEQTLPTLSTQIQGTNPKALFEALSTLSTYKETLTQLLSTIHNEQEFINAQRTQLTHKRDEYSHAKQQLKNISAQQEQLNTQLITHFGFEPTTVLTSETFEMVEQLFTLAKTHAHHQTSLTATEHELTQISEQISTKEQILATHATAIDELDKQISTGETLIASLEENLALTHELSALKKHFEALVEGVPCPVCGSPNHPNKHKPSPFDDTHRTRIESELQQNKTRLHTLNQTLKQHEITHSTLQNDLNHLHNTKQIHTQSIDKLRTELAKLTERMYTISHSWGVNGAVLMSETQLADYENYLNNQPSQYATLKANFRQLHAEFAEQRQELDRLETDGKALKGTLEHHESQFGKLAHQFISVQSNTQHTLTQDCLKTYAVEHLTLTYSTDDVIIHELSEPFLVHGKAYLARLTELIDVLQATKTTHDQHQQIQEHIRKLSGDLHHYHNQQHALNDELTALQQQIQSTDNTIRSLTEERHSQFGTTLVSWLGNTPTPSESVAVVITQQSHALQESLEKLNTQKHTLQAQIDALLQDIGKNTQIQSDNEHAKHAQTALLAQIDIAKTELATWDKLNTLIGSKDGKKYRVFAQGLTLDLLLHHANQALATMNERYILCTDDSHDKTALQIYVIDTAQGGELRSTKNLSGGESFIISLALAIGLSMMNSDKVSIDSLFLDEGFGTLDEETLDIALATLSALHTKGQMIGIISHISSLKEQISTQIIVKKGVHGKSTLSGAGVRCLE